MLKVLNLHQVTPLSSINTTNLEWAIMKLGKTPDDSSSHDFPRTVGTFGGSEVILYGASTRPPGGSWENAMNISITNESLVIDQYVIDIALLIHI